MSYKSVKATERGYFYDRLVEKDEVFSVPANMTAKWWVDVDPVDEPKSAKPKAPKARDAVSEPLGE